MRVAAHAILRLRPLLIAGALAAPVGCASAGPVDTQASMNAGHDGFRPALVAISVADLDASVRWYVDVLGFQKIENYDFPEDKLRMAFLDRSGFELELLELAAAVPFGAPDPGNPATRRGIGKLAFQTNDIDALYARAIERRVRVQSELKTSKRRGRFFILLDPDGNWIQVFGR